MDVKQVSCKSPVDNLRLHVQVGAISGAQPVVDGVSTFRWLFQDSIQELHERLGVLAIGINSWMQPVDPLLHGGLEPEVLKAGLVNFLVERVLSKGPFFTQYVDHPILNGDDEWSYGFSWRQLFLAQFDGEIGFLEGLQSLAQECQFFGAKILSIDGRLAAGFVNNSEVTR